jgi:hypothetical protein|tara:strand:+ start:1233 stop:1541 length:309 start_codon:yes stop_codon:yes gene_type:complete
LFKYLKKFFSSSGDEHFLQFISVARQDEHIREQLISILNQDPFNRKSSLNTWVRTMQFQQAPESFVHAATCLLEDDIADKALQLLSEAHDQPQADNGQVRNG